LAHLEPASRLGDHPNPREQLTLRIRAGAIYPVASPPIAHGAILIDRGKIVALGADSSVPMPDNHASLDFPDAVLLPGFVNVHTHLELSSLRTIECPSFYDWIQTVRAEKARLGSEEFVAAATQGLHDAWRHGITTVADTGDSGAAAQVLAALGGRGVVFLEVFGPHPEQANDAVQGLENALASYRPLASDLLTIGISPHAPYSVSGPLYHNVARLSQREGLPVAVHLAESRAEVDLVTNGSGPFANAWHRRGIPKPQLARSPVAYLRRWGVLEVAPLVIHAVQVDSDDVRLLAAAGCAIASCPVSNHNHGHGSPPLHRFREAGIRLGIGTDSVASVGTIDIRRDGRLARDLLDTSSAEVVEMLTLGGARALGLERLVGSLDVGKCADLCVMRLPNTAGDLAKAILEAPVEAVVHTFVAGRSVYQRPQDNT
jgi:cytosine/adenosine deaminase-related metal-dependent hydrolase